jgi:hypothetical protein
MKLLEFMFAAIFGAVMTLLILTWRELLKRGGKGCQCQLDKATAEKEAEEEKEAEGL